MTALASSAISRETTTAVCRNTGDYEKKVPQSFLSTRHVGQETLLKYVPMIRDTKELDLG